jgi:putative transposase
VLNYTGTSNHVHLLFRDRGKQELLASMQLVAGCVAQEYKRRKSRKGAYWEDRYLLQRMVTLFNVSSIST